MARQFSYTTPSGITVTRTTSKAPYKRGLQALLRDLDRRRGIYLSSGYEYPGRYSRWDIASIDPPLEIFGAGRDLTFRPLNERGCVILHLLQPVLATHPHWESFSERADGELAGRVGAPGPPMVTHSTPDAR